MIYNFWVRATPFFRTEMALTYDQVIDPFLPDGEYVVVQGQQSATFPLTWYLPDVTRDIWLYTYTALVGEIEISSHYSLDSELSDMVPIRESFQELCAAYPNDFECVGSWDMTGQPIGGVGSPWFQTPEEYKTNDHLMQGQADRIFI